jgi:F plasmid transfer operon, TraF, protein
MPCRLPIAIVTALLAASAAWAQPEPPVGVRAAGMGGAFVAVADDATAVYWNPAGLATGSFFSLVIDRNAVSTDEQTLAPREGSGLLLALGTPPLGLTYYQTSATRVLEASPSTVRVGRLVTHQTGATLVQSIGAVVTVGATLKFVRGVTSSAVAASGSDLDVVDAADDRGSNAFDADVGVMVTEGAFKAGVTARNLLEPTFALADGSGDVPLQRRVRAGVSFQAAPFLRVAADSDLTTADDRITPWRDAAVGAEAHVPAGAVVRGGIHWNTASDRLDAAPVGSLGITFPVYRSILADAQASFGSRNGDRGWGVGVRVLF